MFFDPPGDSGDPTDPPDDTNKTHIYSTYPTHIGPGMYNVSVLVYSGDSGFICM